MAGKPSQKAPPPEVVVPLVTEDTLVESEITDEITSKPKEDGREGNLILNIGYFYFQNIFVQCHWNEDGASII